MIQLKYLKGLLIIIGFLSLVPLTGAKAQCKIEFEFRSEVSEKGGNTGKIFLTKKAGGAEVTFRLYNLFNGKNEFTKIESIKNIKNGEEIMVFESIPASTYIIQVEDKNCKKTLGGMKGIEVKPSR